MGNSRLVQFVIWLLILAGVFYYFRADILNFINNLSPGAIKSFISGLVNLIMEAVAWFAGVAKTVLQFVVDSILKIIANFRQLMGLLNSIADLLNKILKALAGILGFISGKA